MLYVFIMSSIISIILYYLHGEQFLKIQANMEARRDRRDSIMGAVGNGTRVWGKRFDGVEEDSGADAGGSKQEL